MIVSPLQLESYFVAESHIVAHIEFKAPDSSAELATRVQEALRVRVKLFDSQEDPARRALELSVLLHDESKTEIPYDVDLTLVGFFHLAPQYRPDDTAHHADLWDVNAPAVLYGIAREILSSFTCRGPYPSICLPTITFADLPAPTETPALEAAPLESVVTAQPKPTKKSGAKAASKRAKKSATE